MYHMLTYHHVNLLCCVLLLLSACTMEKATSEDFEKQRIEQYIADKKQQKLNGTFKVETPEMYGLIQKDLRTPIDRRDPEYGDNHRIEALNKIRKLKRYKTVQERLLERGPSNVAGRTRALIVSSRDLNRNTWLAGSASGGIWKTVDGGQIWEHKTQMLPNLGTNTLAISEDDPDVVYAGTGEHFTRDIDGSGMFKSEDFGETWTQIANPKDYPDFRNVSRIIVDPNDVNVVIATTRNSIWADSMLAAVYKTIDGGRSWKRVLSSRVDRYDDINFNPLNFNTQYIAINGKGVIKSIDGGLTWIEQSEGMTPQGRVEIDVSPVDTNRIWASVQGSNSGNGSDLYVSRNGGDSWELVISESQEDNVDFLGGQGWFDNIITAHPFDPDIVYVGGINLWKFTLTGESVETTSFDLFEQGTSGFMSFVNGNVIGGGVDIGNADDSLLTSVEVRFGQGTQKAHRFTVNMRGPGVPILDYEYNDYVEVPFQVWDVDNNVQLMVSFRDQQEDGTWDLKNYNVTGLSDDDSREYIFIHAIPYADTAHTEIARNGGHDLLQMYFMWPYSTGGNNFDPQQLPHSALFIEKSISEGLGKETHNISDAYGEFSGRNAFTNIDFSKNKGIHPDQHGIVPLIEKRDSSFRLLIANDGGLYVSNKSEDPGTANGSFNYAGFGFNTTQFYSADKAPGVDRYIGGMQDNSTWFTPRLLDTVNAETRYEFAFGGDGFEAIWNNRDDQQMIGSIQFNNFQKSMDGGKFWHRATTGIDDEGPFISRLANAKAFPDRLFTVGSSGVWVSNDFGDTWLSSPIGTFWSFNNSADIEVSLADFDVIWAGGALDVNRRLFVSQDGGNSFSPSNYYAKSDLGFVSGIATHPHDPRTAYALFSFANRPKVLVTHDLGQTWEDLSGFQESNNGESTNGFPDVAVNTLFVFPSDTDRIWVGTEIGIIESLDNGRSWNYLDTELGAANVADFILQDDQLVIATYGRGIWTAQIEGVNSIDVFPPFIRSTAFAPTGLISMSATFFEKFDSSYFLLNDQVIDTIRRNDLGDLTLQFDEKPQDGENTLQIVGYLDSLPYESNRYSFDAFALSEPVTEYFTDFSDVQGRNDFSGEGFSIYTEEGFSDPAIHTEHPYANQSELTFTFNRPILIEGEQILSYLDVAIIESGEANSVFGDDRFYDYVIIEATVDGIHWVPLLDGYDARFDTNWLDVYNSESAGSSELFILQEINLGAQYDQGDLIFVRFRLSADPLETGWGWAIDNFSIEQTIITPTVELSVVEFNLYPNPTNEKVTVTVDQRLGYKYMSLFDLKGQQLRHWDIRDLSTMTIDVNNYAPGLYFIRIGDDVDYSVRRLIIE